MGCCGIFFTQKKFFMDLQKNRQIYANFINKDLKLELIRHGTTLVSFNFVIYEIASDTSDIYIFLPRTKNAFRVGALNIK